MTTVLGVGAWALAHERACPVDTPVASPVDGSDTARTLAVRLHCYGGPSTLRLAPAPRPALAPDAVLVQVHVASTNPLDWHEMRGEPYLMRLVSGLGRPGDPRFGADFAGVVAAIGDSVSRFAVGDTVFGETRGAFAEFLIVRESGAIVQVPSGVSLEQAAALPVAASTALQALRDHGNVAAGSRVLVNGASGGVGHFATQLAVWQGAHVTGVASTRNLELVRSLGAHVALDYTVHDFTRDTVRYDVIIDLVGNHAPSALRRALVPGGRVVIVGGPDRDRWLGPVRSMLSAIVYGWFVREAFVPMLATTKADELTLLASLVGDGTLRAVIDQRFPLAAINEAIAYQQAGRSRGKNLVLVR